MTDYTHKETPEPILFIYHKDNKIKALALEAAKWEGQRLKNEGWNHTATIHAGTFIEHIYNNLESSDELSQEIKELLS
jgi:hypothetical protein